MPCPINTTAPVAERRIGAVVRRAAGALAIACSATLLHAQTRSLDFYLHQAEVNSPVLKDLAYQRRSLALDSADVHAAYGPQVNGSGQFLYAPSGTHWGYDSAITNGGLYAAVVGVQLPLFTGGRKQTALDSVALHANALLLAGEGTVLDLHQRVTDQYITAYAVQRSLAEVEVRLQLLAEEEAVMQRLTAQGIYPQIDLANLRVNRQAQRIAATKANAMLRSDLSLLNALCGLPDTALGMLGPIDLTPPATYTPSASPGLRQFTVDSLANAIADHRVDLGYRARLSAVGDAGLNAVAISEVPNRFGTSAGLNLSVPIYDGDRRRTAHQRIALREMSRTAYRDYYAEQLQLRHARLLQALAQADSLLAGTQRQSADEERLIGLYRTELEHGLVRLTDLFLALENHARTVNDMILAEADRSRIINALTHLQ